MIKKSSFIIISCIFVLSTTAIAAVPEVNQYKIEKRSKAIEPAPSQYSISANDVAKVRKPLYATFTRLNLLDRSLLFRVPPFPHTKELPMIGKWMVAIAKDQKKKEFVPSHWLDDKSADGRYIIEPINYVFVVYAESKPQAIALLKKRLVASGFTMKWSGAKYHSGNYHAFMNNQLLSQLKRPDGVFITFSDDTWLHQNDHFRVMGTFVTTINGKKAFLFASSVSEESLWNQKLYAGHYFVSFGNARNNLAVSLIKTGNPTYFVISNNVLNTAGETTEDHDGKIYITVIK